MQFLWQAEVERRWYEATTDQQRQRVRDLEDLHMVQMPANKVVDDDDIVFNTWSVRNTTWGDPLHPSVANDEGQVLHFDFTYRAVGGIWVDAPVPGDAEKRQRAELSYVLGTVLGSTSVVLASIIASTESWDNIQAVFRMALDKTGVPPQQIWVDDYSKWAKLLLSLVTDVFGPGHGTRIGLDWRHFKELLLGHMDKRNPQFLDVKRDVESLLPRMREEGTATAITTRAYITREG